MRLGGPAPVGDPSAWIAGLKERGYGAAYCPVEASADDATVAAYASAAAEADIVIAEVGAWSNPLSRDDETRTKAIEYCRQQLHLADRIGARCCVNISGSRGEQWDGHHPDNHTVRAILDAVRPRRTFYTLETMPWAYPDSVESYGRLVEAIDRAHFGVHLDPVNLICSPQRYYANGALLRHAFATLGPHIKSCHAKDIRLTGSLTTHLEEVRPGQGNLDYATYLRELSRLDNVPLMLEHLPDDAEYRLAADYVRGVAGDERV